MFKNVHETKFVFYSYVSYVEVDRLLAFKIFKGSNDHIVTHEKRRANKVGANQPVTILCWEILVKEKMVIHCCS